MPTQIHEGRAVLIAKIEGQLGAFLSSMEIAIRNNLPNRNVLAETTMKGLLNRIHRWDLVNANSIRQNFPGIDLIDTGRKIGIQVTSTNDLEKVDHTLEQVKKLPADVELSHLYILILTNSSPTATMKRRTQAPYFSGGNNIWNIPELLRQMQDLEATALEEIHTYLEAEVGTLRQKMEERYLNLRPASALGRSGFVGRQEEMKHIRERLAEGDKLIVLSGLGGMGKTELAVRFGQDYTGGAVYFTKFEDNFTHTVAKMAEGLRPKLSKAEAELPEADRCELVLGILEGCDENDILIIDNVDADGGTLKKLMDDPAYVQLQKMEIRLILTTRFDHDRSLIGVRAMDDAPLFQIFTNHGANIPETDRKALIDAVNGHTLTIDLIARTLADNWTPVTPAEMLEALDNSTLADADFAEVDTDYQGSTEQLHIYQRLRKVFEVAKVPPMEQDILRFATLLPESGMDVRYFRAALTKEQQKAFPSLGKRGWLTAEDKLLTIHPVIRLVCREELKPSEENCTAFLDALWGQLDVREYNRVKFAQMAEVFAGAMEIDGRPETKAEWLNNSGRLYGDLGQRHQERELYENHLSSLEKLIPGHPALTTAYNNVGSTYGDLGDHNMALEYQLKALTIWEKVLPPEHPDLATSYNNVGSTYGDLGDHNKALEYQLKALAIREEVLPPDHPDLATSYNNVGTTYGALGDHNNALEYLLKALAIQEKVLPPEHPSLAISYGNVGVTYGALGDHNKALEFKLKALAICEKVLPPEHPSLATSYNNVGFTYMQMGKFSDALNYVKKAVVICEKSLPEGHPDTENARYGVAILEMLVQLTEMGIDPQELLKQLQ